MCCHIVTLINIFVTLQQSSTIMLDCDIHKWLLGKIMNMGNTFVRIRSLKFLAAFFRSKNVARNFSAKNLHIKLNNALEICVQYFLDEFFLLTYGLFLTALKTVSAKEYFGQKPKNGTICRKLQILSSLLDLWR
jgi:hypothetical protein